jgi:hypothetical protein
MLSPSLSVRLATQLEALATALGDATPETLAHRPSAEKWSAHENLAHVARHHEVFLERVERILSEDAPQIARYRAEDDPEWPRWAALATATVLDRLKALRQQLVQRVTPLDDAELARIGVHSAFGPLPLAAWIEFFLLHEAHHLYVIMGRARGPR